MPEICNAIKLNEDLADCREAAMGALDACNAQLLKAQGQLNKGK